MHWCSPSFIQFCTSWLSSHDAVSPGDGIVVVDTVCDLVYFVGVFIILCWLSQMIRGFCGRFLVCLREIVVMFESQRGLSC